MLNTKTFFIITSLIASSASYALTGSELFANYIDTKNEQIKLKISPDQGPFFKIEITNPEGSCAVTIPLNINSTANGTESISGNFYGFSFSAIYDSLTKTMTIDSFSSCTPPAYQGQTFIPG